MQPEPCSRSRARSPARRTRTALPSPPPARRPRAARHALGGRGVPARPRLLPAPPHPRAFPAATPPPVPPPARPFPQFPAPLPRPLARRLPARRRGPRPRAAPPSGSAPARRDHAARRFPLAARGSRRAPIGGEPPPRPRRLARGALGGSRRAGPSVPAPRAGKKGRGRCPPPCCALPSAAPPPAFPLASTRHARLGFALPGDGRCGRGERRGDRYPEGGGRGRCLTGLGRGAVGAVSCGDGALGAGI